jgi:hypothetical protein
VLQPLPEGFDGLVVIEGVGEPQPLVEVPLGQRGIGGDAVVQVTEIVVQRGGRGIRLGGWHPWRMSMLLSRQRRRVQ